MTNYTVRIDSFSRVLDKVSSTLPKGIEPPVIYQELEKLKQSSVVPSDIFRKKLQRYSDYELMNMYWTTIGMIRFELKLEQCRTKYEKKFEKLLRRFSRLHFFTSYWIGNCCTDIFLPRYKLVIEIDGGIHDCTAKMLKDEFRDDFFKSIGLMTTHLENHRVARFINDLIQGVRSSQIKQIDTRSKKRMMRKIYIESIIRLRPYLKRYYKFIK